MRADSIPPLAFFIIGGLALWWLLRRPARRVSGSVGIDTYMLEGDDTIYIAPGNWSAFDLTVPRILN